MKGRGRSAFGNRIGRTEHRKLRELGERATWGLALTRSLGYVVMNTSVKFENVYFAGEGERELAICRSPNVPFI